MSESKQEIRTKILTLLRNQEENKRITKSLAILEQLFDLSVFKKSNSILFYASFDGEVETFEMIKRAKQSGKKIGLPRVLVNEGRIVPVQVDSLNVGIEAGPYGILQPLDKENNSWQIQDIDMIIVPGVAFDQKNNRLGRGKGYYDRFLKSVSAEVFTVGLAFDFQRVDNLPFIEEHDIPVSQVLTN